MKQVTSLTKGKLKRTANLGRKIKLEQIKLFDNHFPLRFLSNRFILFFNKIKLRRSNNQNKQSETIILLNNGILKNG